MLDTGEKHRASTQMLNVYYQGLEVRTLEPAHLGSNPRWDTLGKLLNLFGPQFSHQDNNISWGCCKN